VLTVGASSSSNVHPGQGREFRFSMQSGDFTRIELDPKDIGVTAVVAAPNRKELFREEGLNGAYGVQRIAFVAASPGEYTITINPYEDASGEFTIALRELRPEGTRDSMWIAANDSLQEAIRLVRAASPNSLSGATSRAESARLGWRDLGDARGEALALCWLGRIQGLSAQPRSAVESFQQAIAMWQKLGERRAEGQAISFQAEAQGYLGPEEALRLYEKALEIRREVGDRRGEAEPSTVWAQFILHMASIRKPSNPLNRLWRRDGA
jgi:tetratricopeptide (TPR) repeat protein